MSIDRQNKLGEYESKEGSILQYVINLTNKIGYAKLASKRDGNILEFRREKDFGFVVPKYEGMMDGDGNYVGDNRLARIINVFSSQNAKLPRVTDDKIVELMHKEMGNPVDDMMLSNGHDVSYLLPHVLRKKCRFRKSGLDSDMIDSILMAAYSREMFHNTNLYQSMVAWCDTKDYKIWLENTIE